ncbi:MAG: hypothetical protein DMG13_20340 [Acidobacteria bacterium]|nr:MAG: hypothetical protein DMG13_20340 [Acidobacteriota bacterium]
MRAKRLAFLALWAILASTACQKRARVSAPPPPAPPPAAITEIESADLAFSSGGYDEAGRFYENYLRTAPNGSQRDLALFRLGLTYVLRTSPAPDWQRATTLWKQLANDHPMSLLKPAATLILSLHSELDQLTADTKTRDQRIRQLSSELERLKKIDAGRGKRP